MTTPPLRSRNWFGPRTLDGLMNRGYLKAEGFSDLVFDGRPVIGIANSWSELNNCNAHLRQLAEAVKRGVWSAGRLPPRVPRHVARRDPDAADDDALPQPHGDGGGGADPRLPARRRRAALRLRQDHAGHADGRGLGRRARHHGDGGPDAARRLARPGDRLGHRRAQDLGGSARRRRLRRGARRGRVLPLALDRPLHGDGHRVDDGRDGGDARHDAARQRRHPRAGLAPSRPRRDERATRRRDGARPRPPAARALDRRGVRQRHPRRHGHRRQHQCHRAPGRHRRPRGRAPAAPALRRAVALDPAARQRAPLGQVPDGGLLLRGRPPRRAEGAAAPARTPAPSP